MKQAIVFQAIDSPRRDMEWRLFMAARLAERGVSSIIGSKSAIRLIHARSSNCIVLGRLDSNTGRTSYDQAYIKEMERKGTAFFFLHDEGGLYYKGEYEDWVRKIYPEEYFGSKALKKVLFWGEAQRTIFDESENKDKFEVTGFPRFDLCKPEFSQVDEIPVSRLKKKYGDFVLVCGRFAAVNMVSDDPSALGRRSFDIRVEGGALRKKNKEEILKSMFGAWEKVSLEFSQFVPAIARLALEFPELNFVLRPHPAEKESFYKEAFVHFDNIFVDKNGDVRPLIRASKLLVHSECTTGLEAELSQKPNINFRPCADHQLSKDYEVAGAADVGVIVKDYSELRDAVIASMKTGYRFIESEYDSVVLAANINPDFRSVDAICNLIDGYLNSSASISKVLSKSISYDYISRSLILRAKASVKTILGIMGVDRFKRKAVVKGDLKFYDYNNEQIRRLWGAFDSGNAELRIKSGVIYVSPKISNSKL